MDNAVILHFLRALRKNNNREWFEKNKSRYLEARQAFETFLEALLAELVVFDAALSGLDPRKLPFRIYRDVRFSKDKRPYKINMGAAISPRTRMEQEPGYYIHLEPGSSFIAGGLYMPDSANLAKVRQEIDYNTDAFLKILQDPYFTRYFSGLDDFDKLKTAPKGYSKDHPYIDLLRYRSFVVSCAFTDEEVCKKNFVKVAAGVCRAIKPLNDFLKEALA